MRNLFIDVHVLQTVPPSNLNRDDTGSPKQATYGGVRRARVSSQAWKRATRTMFAAPEEAAATRTRLVSKVLIEPLVDKGLSAEDATRLAKGVLQSQGLKVEEPKAKASEDGSADGNGRGPETQYLLFLGMRQRDNIVDKVVAHQHELLALDAKALEKHLDKELQIGKELQQAHPIDVALFGRMVADQASLNVDAAVQVAHALSTHPVEVEFDYFTAVDDEKARDKDAEDVGAGMIGTVEFNSSTLYRYASVGFSQLVENLDGSVETAADAARTFVDCFARSMPTGHQNSFAHRTLPHAVVVTVREDQPVNLVSAFEKPVRYLPNGKGLAEQSVVSLAAELEGLGQLWANPAVETLASYHVPELDDSDAATVNQAFDVSRPFPTLLDELHQLVAASQPATAKVG